MNNTKNTRSFGSDTDILEEQSVLQVLAGSPKMLWKAILKRKDGVRHPRTSHGQHPSWHLMHYESTGQSVRKKHRQVQSASDCTARHITPAGEGVESSPAGPHGTTRSSKANRTCRCFSRSQSERIAIHFIDIH